jgi:hypothetical protein
MEAKKIWGTSSCSSTNKSSIMNEVYLIESDVGVTPNEVLKAVGLPRIGDKTVDKSFYVESVDVSPMENEEGVWRASVKWTTPTISNTGSVDPEKPWEAPPDVDFGLAQSQVVCSSGYENETDTKPKIPILNSAGDLFDPPLMKVKTNLMITVSYSLQSSFNPDSVLGNIDTLNKENIVVAGFKIPALMGLLKSFSAKTAYTPEDVMYWTVSVGIEYNPEGWTADILDAGLSFLKTEGSTKKKHPVMIEDEEGKKVRASEPIPLDGSGGILDVDSHPEGVYLQFKIYRASSWSSFQLPKKGK